MIEITGKIVKQMHLVDKGRKALILSQDTTRHHLSLYNLNNDDLSNKTLTLKHKDLKVEHHESCELVEDKALALIANDYIAALRWRCYRNRFTTVICAKTLSVISHVARHHVPGKIMGYSVAIHCISKKKTLGGVYLS